MKKRIIAFMIVLSTAFSMLCVYNTASAAVGFTDLKVNAYYYNAVDWAVENGVTSGTSATEFSPGATCTRAQVVSFLWRAAGSPSVSGSNPFRDISPKKYYYTAVLWAVQNGITSGVTRDRFDPNGSCTRAQVVSFLHRAANSPSVSTANPFYDVTRNKYFYNAVLWAVDSGVTSGVSATSFAPSSVCTRAQVVSFLYRYYCPLEAKIDLAVFKKDNGSTLRTLSGNTLNLATLSSKEGFTYRITLKNQSAKPMAINSSYVMINGKKYTGWASFTLSAGVGTYCTVYYTDVAELQGIGTYTVEFYVNEARVSKKTFVVTKYDYINSNNFWSSVFPMPTAQQISSYKNPKNLRSQYITGWWSIGSDVRFTEYTVDLKADYLPIGTYCCPANFNIDYSSLENKYTNIRQDYISGYAGLQNTDQGKKAIMSMWDIYATEKSTGKNVTLRPRLVWSNGYYTGGFTGEGEGQQCIGAFEWKASHWYRIKLVCHNDSASGNTFISFYVCDLETMEWTKICTYDTLVKNTCFKGNLAVFLENYIKPVAGDVRTMEIRNGTIRLADSGKLVNLDTMHLGASGVSGVSGEGYDGSYAFGATGDRFWMITSGVGGDWYNNGLGQRTGYYTVS